MKCKDLPTQNSIFGETILKEWRQNKNILRWWKTKRMYHQQPCYEGNYWGWRETMPKRNWGLQEWRKSKTNINICIKYFPPLKKRWQEYTEELYEKDLHDSDNQLDYKESWALKHFYFWTVVLEKTLESPLNWKEIQPVHPKGNQSWKFFGRTDAEAETPILWLPDAKSQLIGKDPDAGKDWRREKGTTEDEMVE